MHIVVADALPAAALDLLRVPGWNVDARAGRPAADLADALSSADALVVRSATMVTSALLDGAPRLRVVARAGTGVDNIDLPAATGRGIVVMNAPGGNSVSVAEHALALMLAMARSIPAADAGMKRGAWEKKRLTGSELRGKCLGILGFGRVGREVAARARAFGMELIAYDPFIAPRAASDLAVPLVSLEELLRAAHYLTLHVPATPDTQHLLNARTLAMCRPGVRIVNTARGDLVDESALADALESGLVAGAALDVFAVEPPGDSRLTRLPQVIATPHIAGSTQEAQEQVGLEIAGCVRDFLRDGVIRNTVNLPPVPVEDFRTLSPLLVLAERLGGMTAQLSSGAVEGVEVRYYGTMSERHADLLGSGALAGVLRTFLSGGISVVNARAVAADRRIELVEARSNRAREFSNVLSVALRTAAGEWRVEGAAVESGQPRVCSLDGIDLEAPLEGVLVAIANEDQPGIIGEIGTLLGRRGLNIARFALGRRDGRAVGLLNVDVDAGEKPALDAALDEIRAVRGITLARAVLV
ncbi:MAG TPA: phosphoglycerate dehydrogenase [Vicinamibacterales bacterium]|nr:phosphoglycerate dehydrogenase [Vicinamibacterales bacterium]